MSELPEKIYVAKSVLHNGYCASDEPFHDCFEYTRTQSLDYQAAIEDAANVCDKLPHPQNHVYYIDACEDCSDAIRALSKQQPTKE